MIQKRMCEEDVFVWKQADIVKIDMPIILKLSMLHYC